MKTFKEQELEKKAQKHALIFFIVLSAVGSVGIFYQIAQILNK